MRKRPEDWTKKNVLPVLKLATLDIDREIRRRRDAKRAPRIQEHVRPIACRVGRRAMEIAITAAETAIEQNPPRRGARGWETGWERQRDTAKKAHTAILGVVRSLGGSGSDNPDVMVTRLRRTRLGEGERNLKISQKEARDDMVTLLRAGLIVRRLAQDAERRRRSFTSALTKADHEKNAFVQKLAEAWVFLTGERPGKGPNSAFLKFAEAAWNDWRGERANIGELVGAAKSALDSMTNAEFTRLADKGPDWMYLHPHLEPLDRGVKSKAAKSGTVK